LTSVMTSERGYNGVDAGELRRRREKKHEPNEIKMQRVGRSKCGLPDQAATDRVAGGSLGG